METGDEIDESTLKHLILTDALMVDRLTDAEMDWPSAIDHVLTMLRAHGQIASRALVESCLRRLRDQGAPG